jgi:hypothetical protein
MKLEKTTTAMRPRGNKANHYHLHLRLKKHLQTCLTLIFIVVLFWTVFTFLGAGRYLNHQPATQDSNLSFIFYLGDKLRFSNPIGSEYSESHKLFLLFSLALFIWVTPRTIVALARGLGGDQRLPSFTILNAFALRIENSCTE